MAYLDDADCLARVQLRLKRPASDELFDAAGVTIYSFMTDAQDEIAKKIATFFPDAMLTAPTALVTSDGGFTWTFGTDVDGASIFALGLFHVYSELAAIPDWPLVAGVDYTIEGNLIRIPHNEAKSGNLYAQWTTPTNIIDGSSHHIAIPQLFRQALVSLTLAKCFGHAEDPQNEAKWQAKYEADWNTVLLAVRQQGYGKGGKTLIERPPGSRGWWRMRWIR